MNAIVLGGSGMLGRSMIPTLVRAGANVLAPTHAELDLTNEMSVRKYITKMKPNFVINCAAMTDVDGCEKDPAQAFRLNADAAGFVASAAKKAGSKHIYVSTDYVFDGVQGMYSEEAQPNPLQIYGQSKFEGEKKVIACGGSVFRVQWLFGDGKRNFIDWAVKIVLDGNRAQVSEEQVGCPSSTLFVANTLAVSLQTCRPGVYHLAHDNHATRLEVVRYICEYYRVDYRSVFVGGPWVGPAPRPQNTSFNTDKLKKLLRVSTLGTWESDVLAYISVRHPCRA